MRITIKSFAVSIFLFSFFLNVTAQERALSLEDIMKFRQIKTSIISEDGKWVVYNAVPDRGDAEVHVVSSNGKVSYKVEEADKPQLSKDGAWVAMQKLVPLQKSLEAKMDEKEKEPKPGLELLNTESGEQVSADSVKSFSFTNDNKWLMYQEYGKKEKAKTGTKLVLKSLVNDEDVVFDFVTKYVVDSAANFLAYVVSDTAKENNGLYISRLSEPGLEGAVMVDSMLWVDQMVWSRQGLLGFVAGKEDEDGERVDAKVYVWDGGMSLNAWEPELVQGRGERGAREHGSWGEEERGRRGEREMGSVGVLVEDGDLEDGWRVYHTNKLRWSKDGERLFCGVKPESEIIEKKDKDTIVNIYDFEEILDKREVDVWHWNDPYINSNQKIRWKKEKDRVYMGYYDMKLDKYVHLADEELPDLRISESEKFMLGSSQVPYARRSTWDGRYYDYYVVDVISGERKMLVAEQQHSVVMSPDGKYVVYFRDGQWYMFASEGLVHRCLTDKLEVPFSDEDWDYPADVPMYYGVHWIGGSDAALIYDKYDIWKFPCDGGEAVCLTEGLGRKEKLQFRIRLLDREKKYFEMGDNVYLSAYHDVEKHSGIYKMKIGEQGVKLLADGAFRINIKAKARESEALLFSKENYRLFPDLWVSGADMKRPLKLSDLGKQTEGFAWGNAELVEWKSFDGTPLQGILIKPGNYVEGKKYPVLVYYYRFFTPMMYSFPDMAINHRPNFPFYASNDYAIFLPDIRFDVGLPGYSATKCLVPGVQKIIDMGVADEDAIGLHGHSWSGYQTAFVITQTNIFAAAIAGAPVSNMTSAYSGIRWGSGLARQFQYEKSQSRIGGSLWEVRDKYIENSPVFFADRIETPLLIEFGDKDEAVPWYQGIELYLAMRRLDKDCVFLQYRGEPHHLKKYANKLDYTIRFKEYMDHYLRGEEAKWIEEGEEYREY